MFVHFLDTFPTENRNWRICVRIGRQQQQQQHQNTRTSTRYEIFVLSLVMTNQKTDDCTIWTHNSTINERDNDRQSGVHLKGHIHSNNKNFFIMFRFFLFATNY